MKSLNTKNLSRNKLSIVYGQSNAENYSKSKSIEAINISRAIDNINNEDDKNKREEKKYLLNFGVTDFSNL